MRPTTTRSIRIGAALLGLVSIGAGLWAMTDARSFFDEAAPFAPYNAHFIHDIGAFQIALGACFAAALVVDDGLLVALAGNACGAVAHAVSHVADRSLGGHASDPYLFGALALVVVGLAVARWRAGAAARPGARRA